MQLVALYCVECKVCVAHGQSKLLGTENRRRALYCAELVHMQGAVVCSAFAVVGKLNHDLSILISRVSLCVSCWNHDLGQLYHVGIIVLCRISFGLLAGGNHPFVCP